MMRKGMIVVTLCASTFAWAENPNDVNTQFFSEFIKNADVRKKNAEMETNELIKLVDSTLHLKMKEFCKICAEATELQERANAALKIKKEVLAQAYKEMLPLEDRLRTLYPDMIIWFDKIKQFIQENNNGKS